MSNAKLVIFTYVFLVVYVSGPALWAMILQLGT